MLWIAPMCFQIKRILMVIRTSGCNETTCVDLEGDERVSVNTCRLPL